MSDSKLDTDPKALQRARAAHLRDLLEPWSVRRLEARTGIGRGTLQTRLAGQTELAMSDIELLAPVIRMTPEELFAELRSVDVTVPTGGGVNFLGVTPLHRGWKVGPEGLEPPASSVKSGELAEVIVGPWPTIDEPTKALG
jgi:hypothetical protein